ncbi:hypothetical protein F7308_1669 [Francisella salina]|uniref:Uncharacterized protein n=1 Tax=Francisella salina TaxID=573569 RepID=A0ABM5MBI8_FRAST|nr:hypothetical protein F7308_1669 [Francisella salina]
MVGTFDEAPFVEKSVLNSIKDRAITKVIIAAIIQETIDA